MVMNADTQEAESVEKEPLVLISNLLWIAIHNISYNRGLFNENCFRDKSVPELGIKVKKLMPMDVESRRLIDWMENGVYDALQKRYLKTLLFCICEKEEGPMIEEYAFSFSYTNTSTEEVAMNMICAGIKKGSTTFTSNASEVTPDQMRSSACKMIRMLVSLMKTLDPMPEERTILMKLLYFDDVTVKSVPDPYDDNNVNSGDDGMSVDDESDQDDFSETEVRPFEADHYIVPPNDDTQDVAREEELRAQVKEWICPRDIGTVNASDVLSTFHAISMAIDTNAKNDKFESEDMEGE
ncbi:hypothetical protein C2845_PM04G22030 [Panicum miliaceum]|uniref:HORMA domain-containing protein n=1 Tax=Panicum miliaceum TaxID=4540 RepID=A0A3L6QUG5_PANMI|nr:hypothetical protein C2845_PM04G22030 [Panicum miliaceum]